MAIHHHNHSGSSSQKEEYQKLYLVLGFILVISILFTIIGGRAHWMLALDYVMGSFFLVFGLFKLLEYKMFAFGYRDYDLLAKRFAAWGYIYPILEVLLGIAYIVHFSPIFLNGFTLILMTINTLGVTNAIRRAGDKPACLCLGAVIKLPLSTISLLENVSMGLMALLMLLALLAGVPHPAG